MNPTINAPQCPKTEHLRSLITALTTETAALVIDGVDEKEQRFYQDTLTNALRYLENFLTSRRGYQKKQMIKRKVIMKFLEEQGMPAEVEDAIKEQYEADMEKVGETDND